MPTLAYEEILDAVRHLSPEEQRRLREALATPEPAQPRHPRRSLYGALADLGPGPSAEDIDEVRREVWANFPRDDI